MSRHRRYSVAFQGEPGAFSHSAATKFFPSGAIIRPFESFREVFKGLKSGVVSHAVIPIENTLHGSVHENYDHLLDYDLCIWGETSIRISHNLIVVPGSRFGQIRRVYSHPVALNQCRRFFDRHKRVEPIPYYDTAGSVKMLMREKPPDGAALASETAAEIYGGAILRRNVEDNPGNFTRFFLLAKQKPKEIPRGTGDWKTSIVFSTRNTPGALFRAMACFALRELNLTKIESRPLRAKPWEYLFYLDIAGSEREDAVKRALANLAEMTSFLKILGSYKPVP